MEIKERQPIIGIPGWKTGENSFGITIPYLQFLNQYGIVKILTLTKNIDIGIDLLVLPGGSDVNPLRYGAEPSFGTSKPDLTKEYFDTVVLPLYIDYGTPVFGICRGMQTIAVLFGASLIQEMYHETNDPLLRSDKVHSILITSKLQGLFNVNIKVNSLHHQCVSSEKLPDCLEIAATYRNTKNNIGSAIEAIQHKELPIMGVQYHPEELGYDPLSKYMIKTLISKSRNYV